ncbi:MAG: radical SAM protein [Clostridiales Family XIII bacterium]|jgi:uncharacterized radical SAM superfamily Fe-S cluster-containing enzyme|nr:radical SAM protein [Clostridiales Family XIII bacterium]
MRILSKTKSICPTCKRPVDAFYVEAEDGVRFRKTCPAHGTVSSVAADDPEAFSAWMRAPIVNVAPRQALTTGAEGECPLHCGVCERHLQTACCVLLDVTDRCNQSCPWCFARAETDASARDPSLAQIERMYDRLIELGEERKFNIQLSGGEPTVRDDLAEIIAMGKRKGFEYIQLNTNGRRLALEDGCAERLKEAGASVAFLQFDGLRDDIYEALRGAPLLDVKLRAVERCRRAGLPVTLVPTLLKGVNLDGVGDLIRYMLDNVDVVKGIHFQPASFFGRHPQASAEETAFAEGLRGGAGKTARADERGGDAAARDYENRVTMFDVMREIVAQSGGLFSREDMIPITAGHPLCCFSGSFLRERDGSVKSLMRAAQREQGASCCCEEPDPLEIIRRDRDFVLNKWDMDAADAGETGAGATAGEGATGAGGGCCAAGTDGERGADETGATAGAGGADETGDALDFDAFISYVRRNRFTLTGMAFQDVNTLDAERLKRCRVQVFSRDERLIPFCAYNSIYRA